MAVDLAQAQVGILLAVQIFDEFFKELVATEILPSVIAADRDTPLGLLNVTLRLNPPDFDLATPVNADPRTELHLTGLIELRPAGQIEGAPITTFPLNVQARLRFVLNPQSDAAPRLGLRYNGVATPPSAPLSAADVDEFFATPQIANALASVNIDLLTPAFDGLEPIFFPEPAAPPDRSDWSTALRLLPAVSNAHMAAVGIFVALPGEDAQPALVDSPLPARTGFALIYNRIFLNVAFQQGAQAQIGQQIDGATIVALSLSMDDDAILVNGQAEKGVATINFSGPILSQLVPGTIVMFQDTAGVSVDVDLPWWADVLLFFRFIPVFWPVLIPLAAISENLDVWKAASDVANAPNQVRSGLSIALGQQLVSLAEGLAVETEVQAVNLEATPDSSRIENGHLLLFAQTFVSTLTETIVNAFYSKTQRRFVQYVLQSGRLFRASELARLVHIGKIVTPGFHHVGGRYMRANPDNSQGNNLEELFGNQPAQPPY